MLDEINAIILDPGYSSTRAGYAGEDTPKSLITSFYAQYPLKNDTNETTRYLFGDNTSIAPRPQTAVRNPMGKDGIVEDWDMAERVWEHSFARCLLGAKETDPRRNGLNDDLAGDGEDMDIDEQGDEEKPLADNPLLMTECGWNPATAREKTIEIAIEKWGTPAFYLARTAPLAAYVHTISVAFLTNWANDVLVQVCFRKIIRAGR